MQMMVSSPREPEGIMGCNQLIVPYCYGAKSICAANWLQVLVLGEILAVLCSRGSILMIKMANKEINLGK